MALHFTPLFTKLRPATFRSSISVIASALNIKQLPVTTRFLSTSTYLSKGRVFSEPKEFLKYNDIVYPPQEEGLPPRPAEVCHMRHNIKYSYKKFWYLTLMLRGKSVDEALKQLEFYEREKGARIAMEVIKEAQDLAVNEHNVEYRSNLWIEHCFALNAGIIYGLRKGARGRISNIHYRYTHFCVRLREGRPPKQYYVGLQTGDHKVKEYLKNLRNRTVHRSL